jgi:Tfp pilus assembly protein FimT
MNKFIKGNSLIEIVIVMAILVVILVITVPKINDFRDNQVLKNTTAEAVNLLNEAKTNTLSSKNSTVYGVHFASDSATLFTGATYDSSAITNKTITFDSLVTLPYSNIVLNGSGEDIIFERLTGNTNNYGTITLQLIGDATKQKVIAVSALGVISLN